MYGVLDSAVSGAGGGASTLNVACLVPNGNLRLDAIGWDGRPASREELGAMREALKLGLDQGAVGLSSGLDYVPSIGGRR